MAWIVAVVEGNDTGGYGVSFPDFPGVGATGRSFEESLDRAGAILQTRIEAITSVHAVLPRIRDIREIRADPDYAALLADLGPDAEIAFALVDVDLPSKVVRVNVTFDDRLLERIDRAAKAAGETRSAFLAAAARMRLAG